MSQHEQPKNDVNEPTDAISSAETSSTSPTNDEETPVESEDEKERLAPLVFVRTHMDEASCYRSDIEGDGDIIAEGVKDDDLEARIAKRKTRSTTLRSERVADPFLVTWDSPSDPANPKNWSYRRKWAATLVASLYSLISAISTSILSPTIAATSKELNISNSAQQQLVISIFVLGYTIGPLFLAPLSELYGRAVVLKLSNLWFLIFNTACGVSQNGQEIIVFRFLAGLGGSAPMAISGGVIADVWRAEERGKAISIYTLMPLLGPAVAPIAGSFIAEYTIWCWAYFSVSITTGVVLILGFFFLQETYSPKILHTKCLKLRKETGSSAWHTEFDAVQIPVRKKLGTALVRPLRLIGTQPLIQGLGLYMAFLYGIMYLLLSTLPRLWVPRYHFSEGIAGLHYIAAGLGFFAGAQVCAPLQDRIYLRLKAQGSSKGTGRPEFRVPSMVPGAALVPVGLLLYGWSAQALLLWVWPDAGLLLLSLGMIVCFQCIQAYIVNAYVQYAASAMAAVSVLRSLYGFVFPLFAPAMYKVLDYGWGNTVLAIVAVVLGWPAPFLLWGYGRRLRAKSQFAAGGE